MISQPRYLPWLGYLRRIAKADVFIIYDNVQRVARGYENRNRLLCHETAKWLTIPIESGKRAIIKDTIISDGKDQEWDNHWTEKHINKIKEWYSHAKHRNECLPLIWKYYRHLFKHRSYPLALQKSLMALLDVLDINTQVILSSVISSEINGGKYTLVDLIKKVEGTHYISGPSCIDYGADHEFFERNGLTLKVDNWKPYVYSDQRDYLGFLHFAMEFGIDWVRTECTI